MLFVGSIQPSDTKQLLLPHCYLPVNCLRFDVGCSRHWPFFVTSVSGTGPQGDVVADGFTSLQPQVPRWPPRGTTRARSFGVPCHRRDFVHKLELFDGSEIELGMVSDFFGGPEVIFWNVLLYLYISNIFDLSMDLDFRWSRYTLGSTVISILHA